MAEPLVLRPFRVELHRIAGEPPWAALSLEAVNAQIAAEVGHGLAASSRCNYAVARPAAAPVPAADDEPLLQQLEGLIGEYGAAAWAHKETSSRKVAVEVLARVRQALAPGGPR